MSRPFVTSCGYMCEMLFFENVLAIFFVPTKNLLQIKVEILVDVCGVPICFCHHFGDANVFSVN